MKKFIFIFVISMLVLPLMGQAALLDNTRGYILLQVEEKGEAWYVNPSDDIRYYMKDGAVAYQMMRNFGLGITDTDLVKIPLVADTTEMKNSSSICYSNSTANRLKGKILLQVQQHGEAWYIYPKTCRMIYMKDGAAAYSIMKFLGLGITNSDLTRINSGADSLVTNTIGTSIGNNCLWPMADGSCCLWPMADGSCSSLEVANAFCLTSYGKDYIPMRKITEPGYDCLKCAEGRTNINGDCGLIDTNTTTTTTATESYDTKCKNYYGSNSYFTGNFNSSDGYICGCLDGYRWNSTKTSCISYDQSCKDSYGNSYSTGLDSAGTNICDCSNGYKWNSTKTSCIISYDQACQNKYGTYSYSAIVNSDGTYTCGCNTGYIFNSTKTSCISLDEYCKATYGADRYYDASKNVCTTGTSAQTSNSLSSTCDQMRAKYQDYSTGVQYSDPIYFSARDSLAEYLNQYCGGAYSKLPSSTSTTSSKIYLGYSGASGTCSTSSIGYTTCNYSNGSSITSHTDSIGYTYFNYNNGLSGTCKTDSLGYTTCNFSDGSSMICSSNSLGTTCNYSNGSSTTCHVDSLGYLSCY